MRALVRAALCVGAASVSACSTVNSPFGKASPPPPPSLLPVSSVVNAIKCELAETFVKRPDLRAMIVNDKDGADIKSSLELKNVVVDYKSAGGGATIPILGIELGPSVSLARSDTTGQTFNIDFSYDVEPIERAPDFCTNPQVLQPLASAQQLTESVKIAGDPFVEMLDGIAHQYQLLGAGTPKVKLSTLTYTSSFSVETDVSGGLNAKIIVFSLSTKAGRKTTESQALKMAFGLNLQAVLLSM